MDEDEEVFLDKKEENLYHDYLDDGIKDKDYRVSLKEREV